METQPKTGNRSPDTESAPTTGPDLQAAQRSAFEAEGIAVESQYVDLDSPRVRIHVIEAGDPTGEPPLLFVHGVMNFGAMFAPLMGQIEGVRMLVIDRPGWGLSGDYQYKASTHRQTAVDVLEGVLDTLEVDQVDFVGHSTGGYWGLALALAHPERIRRLVAIGGVPAFPGTSPPVPLRLYTVPMLARLFVPRGHPTEETVVKQLSIVKEQETILRYPELVGARVAHDRNPRAMAVGVNELRSFQSLLGWRAEMRLTSDEVRSIEQPTTFVWGDEDFLGPPDAVRPLVESMPDAGLETLAAGHIPWLGHPGACADLVLADRL